MAPFVARRPESRSKIVVETVTSPPDSPRGPSSDVVRSEVAPAASPKAQAPVVSGNSGTPNTSKTRSVRVGGIRRFKRPPPSSRVPPSDVVQSKEAPSTAPQSQAQKIPNQALSGNCAPSTVSPEVSHQKIDRLNKWVGFEGGFQLGTTTTKSSSSSCSKAAFDDCAKNVSDQRQAAEEAFRWGDYRSSVMLFTKAIASCSSMTENKFTLAELRFNRASALFRLGAYAAAVSEYRQLIGAMPSPRPVAKLLPLSATPSYSPTSLADYRCFLLKIHAYIGMARASLKLGDSSVAETAFENALRTTDAASIFCKSLSRIPSDCSFFKQHLNTVTLIREELALGKANAWYLKHILETCSLSTDRNASFLDLANIGLSISPASDTLILQKLELLSLTNRWKEVAGFCERLAARNVVLDHVFIGDLQSFDPFPDVPPTQELKSDFFGNLRDEEVSTREWKLESPIAVAEAMLRIPMAAQPFYLHALRYEGRFMAAKAATSALHAAKYRQISKIRVEQIRKKKMQADRHFFLEDFTKAISMYQECLDIDPKVLSSMSDCDFEEVTSRDCCVRVHVILYYRLAACFMSLQKWEAAICELNKVLTIYPFFLNAIFCRCRCYSRLNRLQMAISDCELWLRLVREAKEVHIPASDVRKAKKVNVPTPVCAYDVGGPNDVSAHDLTLVQEEWNNLQKKLDSSKEVVAKLPEKCTSHISLQLDCSADLATDSGEFYRKQAVIRLPDTFMQQTAESATMVSSDFTTFPVVEISSESSRRLNHDTRNVTEKAVICSADVQMKSKCNDDGQCAAVPETFKMASQFISSSMEADDTKLLVDDDAISISQTGPILAADSTENAIDSTKEMLLLSMKREISSMKFREELEIPDNDTSPLAFLKQESNDLNVNHPLKEEVLHLVESPESEGTDLLRSYGLSSIISEKDIRLSKLDAGCQECNSKSKLVEDFVEVVPERGQLKDSVVEEKREKTPLCPLGDEGIDLIYLKCVVVQYLALPPLSMERKSLLPVLGALLQFEDGDYRRLGDGNDDPSREASSSWWSGLSGWEL